MDRLTKIRDMEEALLSFDWLDPHTHIDSAHLSARGLDDILLYHMSISDLYAAGCPSGGRLDDDRSTEEAHRRLREAMPFVHQARNTGMAWGMRIILEDLYGWTEPITEDNWQRLDARIAERGADPSWTRTMFKRARIVRTGTEYWRAKDHCADDLFQYSLEWAFFTRTQWGQPDIPLYELERAWNEDTCGKPIPVTFDRASAPPHKKIIRTVDDVNEAIAHYIRLIPYGKVFSTATHVSTDINYTDPDDDAMAKALKRRAQATDVERDIYSSYINNQFLADLERHGDEIVYQFSFGAEPLPFETASRLDQRSIAQIARIAARFPKLKFMCFESVAHANQGLCTLARELPNFYMVGYWWHNFFPYFIRQVMEERLDMLPVNKQVGFFSDAYTADWAYAKARIVRRILAEVLVDRIDRGQFSWDDALSIAKLTIYDSSKDIFGLHPA